MRLDSPAIALGSPGWALGEGQVGRSQQTQRTQVGLAAGRTRLRGASAVLIALALVAGLSGCQSIGLGGDPVPAEQRTAYQTAMGHLPANPAAAENALADFLALYPRSRLADDACEQLAQLAFADGRDEEGVRWLARILADYPKSDRAGPARLRLAQFEYARDKRETARRLLDPLEVGRLSRADQRSALRLAAALARTPMERLEKLSRLRVVLAREVEERSDNAPALARLELRVEAVDREIAELIERAASPELEAMLADSRGRPPAGAVSIELARRAIDAGQLELAGERIAQAESFVEGETERLEWTALSERLARSLAQAEAQAGLPPLRSLVDRPRPSTADAEGTLGVVLPLSGDFAEFGTASLRGILLATGLFEAVEDADATLVDETATESVSPPEPDRLPSRDLRLIVRDSRGEPERAAALVAELAEDPSVVAVIGPVFSQESLAAAGAAEVSGVPLVTLSTRQDLPAERANAFRTRTTPEDEVGALVRYAFEELGAERFAVLYPETRYGRGMRKIYWEEVVARGGRMVAASSYDPEAVDFSNPIRDMIGYRFLTSWERKALSERDDLLRATRRLPPEQATLLRDVAYSILGPEGDLLPPLVDFDVLFIPDAGDKIALIAPGLAFHEISDVTLLGSSDWLSEDLLQVAWRHLRGAVISAPFHAASDLPFVTEFVEGYRGTFDDEPEVFAAEAWDATQLVLSQLSAGRRDRSSLREGLLETRAYPGATGVLTMRPDGNARRRPFLLGVSGRRVVPVD